MNFRALKAEEIDVRIGGIYKTGVTLLLYKNARVDMDILDETLDCEYWQRDHKELKGNMYCGIGIYNGMLKEWIWKWDCGKESVGDKEKGEASDSFKRAGFNWGIGRELYTAPFIWLPVATNPKANGKGYELNNPKELDGLYVSELDTEDIDKKRYITHLVISQEIKGKSYEIFKWRK